MVLLLVVLAVFCYIMMHVAEKRSYKSDAGYGWAIACIAFFVLSAIFAGIDIASEPQNARDFAISYLIEEYDVAAEDVFLGDLVCHAHDDSSCVTWRATYRVASKGSASTQHCGTAFFNTTSVSLEPLLECP